MLGARWIAGVALVASGALGQVTGTQGTAQAPGDGRQRFESPMVLETPFTRIDRLPKRGSVVLSDLSEFWCEDARLLAVSVQKTQENSKTTRFRISGFVFVRPSFDRTAHLSVDLVAGEQAVARGADRKIDAEEEKSTPFKVDLDVPAGSLARLREAGEDEARIVFRLVLEDNS